jgi:hypothetical protein
VNFKVLTASTLRHSRESQRERRRTTMETRSAGQSSSCMLLTLKVRKTTAGRSYRSFTSVSRTASTPQPRKNRSDSSRLCHSLASTPQSLTMNSTMLSTKLAAVW